MIKEKVFFKNSNLQNICGLLEETSSERERVVVLVHGGYSSKSGSSSTEVSKELISRGV